MARPGGAGQEGPAGVEPVERPIRAGDGLVGHADPGAAIVPPQAIIANGDALAVVGLEIETGRGIGEVTG
jgi:hypothetical protein